MVAGTAAAAEVSVSIDAVGVRTTSAVISCTFVDICTFYMHKGRVYTTVRHSSGHLNTPLVVVIGC